MALGLNKSTHFTICTDLQDFVIVPTYWNLGIRKHPRSIKNILPDFLANY